MYVLSELCLQWGHHGELIAHKDYGEQFLGTRHQLLLKVLIIRALGNELRYIVNLVGSPPWTDGR